VNHLTFEKFFAQFLQRAEDVADIVTKLHKTGGGVAADQSPLARAKPDPAMVKLLVRVHDLKRKLIQGIWDSLLEFARAEGLNDSYATRLLRLAYLALGLPEVS